MSKLDQLEQRLRAGQDPARVRYTRRLVDRSADQAEHMTQRERLEGKLKAAAEREHQTSLALLGLLLVAVIAVAAVSWLALMAAFAVILALWSWAMAHSEANAARRRLSKHGDGRYRLGGE